MADNTTRAPSAPTARSAMSITLYLNQDRQACSVVRYSDGGDALEWFHDVALRRALEIVAELHLHTDCDVQIALCRNGKEVQTFSAAGCEPANRDVDLK